MAALLLPDVSERVAQGRLEKLRATWEAKLDGGWSSNLTTNPGEPTKKVDARVIVARMMRVSVGYVAHALRIQREAPELFEQLHAGTISMQEAVKKLSGEVDDARRQEVKAARSEFSREANDPVR